MTEFDLQNLRAIANEGIARHGLRGYARKLGLDVSTMRSLRDGRDMQISKLAQIVAAMDMRLALVPAPEGTPTASPPPQSAPGEMQGILYHPKTPPAPGRPEAPIALHGGWLQAHGWEAEKLRCIDAPAPFHGRDIGCLSAGALCLVECSQSWPDEHALWAYLEDDILKLGHVSRPRPGLLLFSGNGICDAPRLVGGAALDRLEPLGRIVWAGAPTCSDRPNSDSAETVAANPDVGGHD